MTVELGWGGHFGRGDGGATRGECAGALSARGGEVAAQEREERWDRAVRVGHGHGMGAAEGGRRT
jgi:hypothetical protein